MADRSDRVHPHDPPPIFLRSSSPPPSYQGSSPPRSYPGSPPPGTYIVQVPKDHIYRYPPKDNPRAVASARADRKPRRCRRCRCCVCFFFWSVVLLAVVAAAVSAAFYFVARPKAAVYSVNGISISGLNVSSPKAARHLSPSIQLTLRAKNPNSRISVVYDGGSSVAALFSGRELCRGAFPEFRQPPANVTVLKLALKGRSVALPSAVRSVMLRQQREGNIPFTVTAEIPFRLKIGGVKLWKMMGTVACHVAVNHLTAHPQIISRNCGDVKVKLWG